MKLSKKSDLQTLSSQTSNTEPSIHYLPFRNMYKVEFTSFIKNSLYFGMNNFSIIICFVVVEIIFLSYNKIHQVFEMGVAIYIIKLIFCFSYQFVWVTGILLTPHYIRQDFGKYHMYLRLLIFSFVIIFVLNLVFYLLLMHFFGPTKISTPLLEGIFYLIKFFPFINIPLLAISNFLRGFMSLLAK